MILLCIMASSTLLMREASRELNAPAGDPAVNLEVRRFQGPDPGGGAPRPRDVRAIRIVNYFEAAWTAAINAGKIAVAPPTKSSKSKAPTTTRATVGQSGLIARDAAQRGPSLPPQGSGDLSVAMAPTPAGRPSPRSRTLCESWLRTTSRGYAGHDHHNGASEASAASWCRWPTRPARRRASGGCGDT